MRIEVKGVIGNKGMKPKMTWDFRKRQGQMVRVPFIRFSMLCEDLTKRSKLNARTKRMERPKEIVQIILPESDRGQNIFPTLSPGRQVTVKGRMTTNPSIGKNSVTGQQQIYSNVTVYMDELSFNDSPLDRQVSRIMNLLKASGTIDEEQTKAFIESANIYLANQQEQYGPPREIEDRTKGQNQPESVDEPIDDSTKDSTDPDNPDFIS